MFYPLLYDHLHGAFRHSNEGLRAVHERSTPACPGCQPITVRFEILVFSCLIYLLFLRFSLVYDAVVIDEMVVTAIMANLEISPVELLQIILSAQKGRQQGFSQAQTDAAQRLDPIFNGWENDGDC